MADAPVDHYAELKEIRLNRYCEKLSPIRLEESAYRRERSYLPWIAFSAFLFFAAGIYLVHFFQAR